MKRTDRQELCNRLTEILRMTGISDLVGITYESADNAVSVQYAEGGEWFQTYSNLSDKDFILEVVERIA